MNARREYEKAVAGWERALKRPHGLQPIAPIETSWWSIKEAEEKKRRRAEEAALAKALEDKNKPAGKKDDKKKGKGKKEKEKGGKKGKKGKKEKEPEEPKESIVIADIQYPGYDRAMGWQPEAPRECPPGEKPGPWPVGPRPRQEEKPRPEQELADLKWQLAEKVHQLKLLKKWRSTDAAAIKAQQKIVDTLRKKVTAIEDEEWHHVCMRVTPDYDGIDEFKNEVVADIERALNTNIRWLTAKQESKGEAAVKKLELMCVARRIRTRVVA